MPLIVENGTGVENANSYLSLEDARSLAAVRGILLPEDDEEAIGYLVRASDRLLAYEDRFEGSRKTELQGLSYPRMKSKRYGKAFPDNLIPSELKVAQIQFANLIFEGTDLWSTGVEGIKQETVGPLTTIYADSAVNASVGSIAEFPQIEAILKPLFAPIPTYFIVGR